MLTTLTKAFKHSFKDLDFVRICIEWGSETTGRSQPGLQEEDELTLSRISNVSSPITKIIETDMKLENESNCVFCETNVEKSEKGELESLESTTDSSLDCGRLRSSSPILQHNTSKDRIEPQNTKIENVLMAEPRDVLDVPPNSISATGEHFFCLLTKTALLDLPLSFHSSNNNLHNFLIEADEFESVNAHGVNVLQTIPNDGLQSLEAFSDAGEEFFTLSLTSESEQRVSRESSENIEGEFSTSGASEGNSHMPESMDAELPEGDVHNQHHLSRRVLNAMNAINAFRLAKCQHWLSRKRAELAEGVKGRKRDALDAAGKLTLTLKLMSLGITEQQLVIDTAQAGGVCENADGFNLMSREFLEIKGSCAKSRCDRIVGSKARQQFAASDLSFDGTWWKKLAFVARTREPENWTNVAEYDECGFWLGIAKRERCEEELRKAGKSLLGKHTVVVSPWTRDKQVCHRSWLGPCIEWIRFKDLTKQWLGEQLGLI